jgi:threonyl-tRNA synthetase
MSSAVDVIPEDAPDYIAHRLAVWDAARSARRSAAGDGAAGGGAGGGKPIRITLPDGSGKEGVAGATTPMDVAMGISETLGRKALVAVVDGAQWDMGRALVGDCALKICDFSTPEGKSVLWHSTAHMLGEAMECKYHGELCIGPPLEDGFYYDIRVPEGVKVSELDFEDLDRRVDRIAKSKRTFERLELTKGEARDMFSYNPFKLEIIEELAEGTTITAYRDGPFIDLCRGPHVPQSTRVKAMMCKSASQAYWRAKTDNPSLARVYGISFPDKKLLKEYKEMVAEAAKRDHRLLGREQELLMFHTLSPGCPFLLPNGQRIFNTLTQFMRDEYWKRGYAEVQTPNMFDFDLWQTSGHAANYKDNMFQLEVEGREFGLKPMNCPSHCVIFGSRVRSHRELPMRLADFGVLHRNELSGSLGGLTRVRRFQQDDAHIFCLPDQVGREVFDFLQFLKYTYDIFGFKYELDLSTRPEKYLGEIEQWDVAEKMLADALVEFTGKQCGEAGGWEVNPGDGAFYGPKIDIKVFDALKRRHQCATLQLDFQLPIRFNLQVQGSGGQAAAPAAKAEGEAPETAALPAAAERLAIAPAAPVAAGAAPEPMDGAERKKLTPDEIKAAKAEKRAAAKARAKAKAAAAARPTQVEEEAETAETAVALSGTGDCCGGGEGGDLQSPGGKLRPGFERPVIIHRAIYGSFERFIAILIEHYGGFWPFWLSPRQAIVVPISEKSLEYARGVQASLRQGMFHVDVDVTDRTMGRKLMDARNRYYNVILVVGESEVRDGTVNMRKRGKDEQTPMTVAEARKLFESWRQEFK